jgi:hypothetical protein
MALRLMPALRAAFRAARTKSSNCRIDGG